MGIFKKGLFLFFCCASFSSLAATYDFQNNLPPTCSGGQGNNQEVVCQSLLLQWNDRIESINQFRRVTILGDANLQNARIYQDGSATNLELLISGNLETNTSFAARGLISVDGTATIGYQSQIEGSLSANGAIRAESQFNMLGSLQSNGEINLASSSVVNGSISSQGLKTSSNVSINGNINVSGDVEIESGSNVQGSISGNNISLKAAGVHVDGNILARNRAFLGHQSRVEGNVTADIIETEAEGAQIGGTARASNITLNWRARIEGDAYATNIENNGGEILGTSYCQSSNGETPVDCEVSNIVFPDEFCTAFNDAIGFGILGTSGFSYGNNSQINGSNIREPDGGLAGTPTTPTPSGELDSTSPGFADLLVDFPFDLTGGPDRIRGTHQVSNIPPGQYGRVATRTGGGSGPNEVTFAGGSLDYNDSNELYYIQRLDLAGNPATIHFREGIYFINEIVGSNQSFFTIEPGDNVIIHIGSRLEMGNEVYLNSEGSPGQLVINLHPGVLFSIGNGNRGTDLFNFNGLLYSPYANTNINLGNNNDVQGGILSAGTVNVGNNTEFTFTEETKNELTQSVGCDESTGPVVERFRIIQPERLVSCRAAPVRVVACANNDCSERFNGPVSVNLQASQSVDWQGGDLAGTSGNNATLNFNDGEGLVGMRNINGGSVQLSIAGSDPVAAASTLCASGNCQTEFVSSGLEVETTAYTRAGETATSIIRALSTGSDGSCQPRLQGRTLPVSIELDCRDPQACAAGQNFRVFADSGAQISNPANPNNLSFDDNGELAITHTYTDVGALRLNVAAFLEETPAPETPPINDPEITLFGSSPLDFYSIPYSLTLYPYKDGSVFTSLEERFAVAGEPFQVVIESRNSSGNITPSFGQELYSQRSLSVSYGESTQPGDRPDEVDEDQLHTGNRVQAVADGVGIISNLVWDEVGRLTLNPILASYFDADSKTLEGITYTSGALSRFIPAYFEIGLSSVEDAVSENICSELEQPPYTYLGQPEALVSFEVRAHNAKGAVTRNYGAPYYDAEGLQIAHFELVSSSHGADRVGGDIDNVSWSAGRFNFNQDNFVYPRRNDLLPDGPFPAERIGIRLSSTSPDEDGVDFEASEYTNTGAVPMIQLEGALNLLYARLNLVDVSGPENEPISVAGEIQVFAFDGNPFQDGVNASPRFQSARFDNCTSLEADRFNRIDGPQVSMSASGSAPVITGAIPDQQFNWQLDSAFDEGNAELLFEYDVSASPWLGFPWRTPGVSENPQALAIFGQYRGNDRIIFWLERGL